MSYMYSSIAIFMIINCCTFGLWRKPVEVKPEPIIGRHSPVEVEPEPIVISDLVGDKIDLEERDRYGLFTNIDDFISAEFHAIPEIGCKIVLITRDKRYVTWNNDPLTPTMLRDYIEHYDSIAVFRSGFEEKWQIVDYDTLGLPITQAEVNKLTRMSFGAKVLFVSGCSLIGACSGCMIAFPTEGDILGPYWDAITGLFIGAAIGTVAGIISVPTILPAWQRAKALSNIKKMRKPKEME
jgi:hypothetical protein